MRLALLGTGDFGVLAARALRDAGHEICCAISQPDRPAGRGRRVQPTPIHAIAEELGIPHHQVDDLNAQQPAALAPGVELGVVVAFGQKIGPAWLTAPRHGMINIHASLLPRHRGAAPFQWAILNGDATTGVTVFQLNERWDAGAILGRRETEIGELETADQLHDRLAVVGAELIVDVVGRIAAGTVEPMPQDASQATRAPKLRKQDAAIDFDAPAFRVQRRIHGLWSWPAATVLLAETDGAEPVRVQLARAAVVDSDTRASEECPAGMLRDDLSVQCASGALRLLEVKPAGKRLMAFDEFARGRRLALGARLTQLPENHP